MAANKVRARQTTVDIAMQQCGQADSIFDVAAANNMGITDELIPGNKVNAPDPVIVDVSAYFLRYNLFPASGAQTSDDELPGGIDFMAVEFDFIVS